MSTIEFERSSKHHRRLCAGCRERKARFSYRGRVHAGDHNLCFACYRSAVDRNRAHAMRGGYVALGHRPAA